MIDTIVKIIPMLTVAGGAVASSPNVKAQIAKLMDATKVFATQQEVSDIVKLIYLDTLDGSQPKPEDFASYLRHNMRTKNGIVRDTSLDQWGKPYALTYDKKKQTVTVTSAGPDRTMRTQDDIQGSYPWIEAIN